MPTFAELAGIDVPWPYDGVSIVPLVTGKPEKYPQRESLFFPDGGSFTRWRDYEQDNPVDAVLSTRSQVSKHYVGRTTRPSVPLISPLTQAASRIWLKPSPNWPTLLRNERWKFSTRNERDRTVLRRIPCGLLILIVFLSAVPASASIKRAWLSKYASFEVLGETQQEPLPGFLTASGEFYSDGKEDAYALSIAPGKDVGVIIDLGKDETITSVVIKNRGNHLNQVGLKVSLSNDKQEWVTSEKWVCQDEARGLEHIHRQAYQTGSLCEDQQGCR